MSAVPPQNLDAEESVLGALLVRGTQMGQVLLEVGLKSEDFYRDRHRLIYEAAKALHERGELIDTITVPEELEKRGDLAKVGGKDLVLSLAAKVSVPGEAAAYARIVVNNADMRRLDAVAKQIQQSVAEREGDPGEMLANAKRLLDETQPSGDPYLSPAQLRDLAVDVAEGRNRRGTVYPWPFDRLNQLTGGVRTGQTVLISGWTHHGKSVLAGQVLESVAEAGAKACLYFNEMDAEEHLGGWLQRNFRVPSLEFVQGRLDEAGRRNFWKAWQDDRLPPFGAAPVAGWDAYRIASHIREHRFDVAVIDILHNIRYEDERDLSNAVNAFVAAAKLADCCVVLVSHLNRGRLIGELRPRPTLRDLRGTGDLENKADIVCFVHREQDPDTAYPLEDGEVFLPKARGGKLGGLEVQFDADRVRFLAVDPTYGAPPVAAQGAFG